MNLIKPTKVKILGTAIVYFAGILHSWVSAGLFLLLFPGLLELLEGETMGIKEKVANASVVSGLSLAIVSFVIEIALLYLAVCLIVHLVKRK